MSAFTTRAGVHARLDGEDDALRHRQVGTGQDHLIHRLGDLSGADRSQVGDRPAHGVEHPVGPFDV